MTHQSKRVGRNILHTMTLIMTAILLIFVVGCKPKATVSVEEVVKPVHIVVWHYYNGEQKKAFDAAVSEFNATVGIQEKIYVESISQSDINTLYSHILASIGEQPGAEPLPDLVFAYSDVAYSLAQLGLLQSYDEYLEESVYSEYVPGFMAEGRILGDGKSYIFPVAKSTEVITVNMTDFELFMNSVNASPDYDDVSFDNFNTWEGIVDASRIYYDWSDGKALFGIDGMANYLLSGSKQLGVDLIVVQDGVSQLVIDIPVMKKLWDTYYEPFVRGWFASYGRFRSDDVKTGDLLAYLGSNSSGAYFPKQVIHDDGRVSPIEMQASFMPVFSEGAPVAIQQGAGVALLKSNDVRAMEASVMFLLWFTQRDRNIEFSALASYIPVRTDAIEELRKQYVIAPPEDRIGKTLSKAIGQVAQGYEMYTPQVFENSYDIRKILETAMKSQAVVARTAVLDAVASGVPYEQAVQAQLSDEAFEKFILALGNGARKANMQVVIDKGSM